MTNLAFATLLRARMRRFLIAQVDLARTLGVATSLVDRWLRGEATPAREDLPRLASCLLLSLSELQLLLPDAHSIETTPRPSAEALEHAAREHWQELSQLPPAFREAVLVAQLLGTREGTV